MHVQRIIVASFALLGASSSFMPWIDIPIFGARSGTELCGWLCFSFYIFSFLVTFLPNIKNQFADNQLFLAIAPAVLASSAVIWQMLELRKEYGALVNNPISKALHFRVEYEFGLYLALSCGVFIAIASTSIRLFSKGL
jgi:hypothetical protein